MARSSEGRPQASGDMGPANSGVPRYALRCSNPPRCLFLFYPAGPAASEDGTLQDKPPTSSEQAAPTSASFGDRWWVGGGLGRCRGTAWCRWGPPRTTFLKPLTSITVQLGSLSDPLSVNFAKCPVSEGSLDRPHQPPGVAQRSPNPTPASRL